jgi:DNA mismatch endonuclease (patch repair protein)
MADRLTPQQRSLNMQAIRQKNTKPEMAVRRHAHQMGYRFRLHTPALPAKPDLVFPSRKKVILVHGCFWHGHNCVDGHVPKTRVNYWGPKLKRNKERDSSNKRRLQMLGWKVLVIWECQTRDAGWLRHRIKEFLGQRPRRATSLSNRKKRKVV